MTDDNVIEALFLLDGAPARQIADEIGSPVPDVIERLDRLEKSGLVEYTGQEFELTELGLTRVDAITA